MPLSPLCLVNNGTTFVPTVNGVDVSPGATVSIRLEQTTGVTSWLLQVIGTDELSNSPVLSNVNPTSNEVTSPSAVVTFTYPAQQGAAIGFRSEVQGAGGPIATTFGVFSKTRFDHRVGFTMETREGNNRYGWAAKINPLIRGAGGTVVDAPDNKNMPALRTTGAGGELACSTGLTATPHPSGGIYISVNGVAVTNIGYGTTSGCACYWSSDNGVTSKTRANLAMNDRLYWNGQFAEFDLSETDRLDFWYEIVLT